MARPLRLEFPGALYHVTCRGNRRERIFSNRADHLAWLDETERVCRRFHFIIHAFCLMENHYHILIETPEGNLGQGMRQLNSAYSQYYNRRHALVGHVMQGRYKAILVQKESYLLQLARYIVLNPVRAGLVRRPDEWEWSSHRYMLGEPAPSWMSIAWLLTCFGADQVAATQAYQNFVLTGIGVEDPLGKVRFQCILGDDDFVTRHRVVAAKTTSGEIAMEQRRAQALSLAEYTCKFTPREIAMAEAYRSTAFSMKQIATHFGVSVKTVSRAVAAFERN